MVCLASDSLLMKYRPYDISHRNILTMPACINPYPLSQRLKLRQIALLAALGGCSSIHGAARALSVTQSTASKSLAEIETVLDVQLFIRSGAGIRPTDAGTMLVAHAKRLLHMLDQTSTQGGELHIQNKHNLVRAGVCPDVCGIMLAKAIALLKIRNADVLVRLEEGSRDYFFDALKKGEIDCVIDQQPGSCHGERIQTEFRYPFQMVLVARLGHPLLGLAASCWDAVTNFEWVLPPSSTPLGRALEYWFEKHGLERPVCTLESSATQAVVSAVAGSDALGLLPCSAAEFYEQAGILKILPMLFEELTQECFVLSLPDEDRQSPQLCEFVKALCSLTPK